MGSCRYLPLWVIHEDVPLKGRTEAYRVRCLSEVPKDMVGRDVRIAFDDSPGEEVCL